MRTLPELIQAHLAGDVTTLAVCWRVERSDAVLILGTEHDRDLTIAAGDYAGTYVAAAGITGSSVRSTSDMSVDNMEVTGAVNAGDLQLVDLSAADIEAGLFDAAAVVLFLVNWEAPDDGQIVLRTGTIGEIVRTAEGQYRTELRGLAQRLTQKIVRTYGASCDAELGDVRCKVNLPAITATGVVTGVTSNREFTATVDTGSPSTSFDIQLFLPMPADIEIGDTFTISPGCDKSAQMCKMRFDNLVNFRGHGFWTPGLGEIAQFGGQTRGREGHKYGGSVFDWFAEVTAAYLAAHPDAAAFTDPDTPYYVGGLVRWTSGDNEGFSMEVKAAA